MHPALGAGSAVEGFLRVDGRMEQRRSHARNIHAVTPLQWNHQLCQAFLLPLGLPDIPLPPLGREMMMEMRKVLSPTRSSSK